MNLFQHIECLFLGGKLTSLATAAINATAPVYYKSVPEAEDLTGRIKPIHKIKYFDVPELSLEFVDYVPEDEEDNKKLLILKVKRYVELFMHFFPKKYKVLSKGQDREIFDKYVKKVFTKAGLLPPSFNPDLLHPDNLIRNGIFFSLIKETSPNNFTIDHTYFSKYEFRKNITPSILKADLKIKNNKLEFVEITRFDKNLKQLEVIPADDSEKFLKARAQLYANMFVELTVIQHLLGCHFLAGFNLNVGTRMLSKENPLKQFLWNFVYGTMSINSNVNVLIGTKVGTVIAGTPFTDAGFYEFVRDSAKRDNVEIFDPSAPFDSTVVTDLKAIKSNISKNLKNVLSHSNKKFKIENDKMFSYLRSKIKALSKKTNEEILSDLVYAVSAYHEVVGNNSIEMRSQSYLATYGVDKYDYISNMLLLVITTIPIRKITAHDVEQTIKDPFAKRCYIGMVRDLLEYETSMRIDNPLHLRIKPSNLEAAVQV